jgi:neutral ceramidase
LAAASLCSHAELKVGVGKGDITGPVIGRGMMGYGDFAQKVAGVHTRLHARAFVVEADDSSRLAFVIADLCSVFGGLREAVLQRLARTLPGRYRDDNLMVMATHTHSGPGGVSHHDLYNITTLGFDRANFDAIVDGIASAVEAADRSRVPGRVTFAKGELLGASINRSVVAHRLNPESATEAHDTNKENVLLSFETSNGRKLGLLDWFPVHATSMSKHNRLMSSDNKGHAAILMERERGGGFVAGFAQSNEGDSSPNIFLGTPEEKSLSDEEKTARLGRLQYEHTRGLLESAEALDVRAVRTAHVRLHMPSYEVAPAFTGLAAPAKLCAPGLGYSFAAGADDGPSGLPYLKEGMKQGDALPNAALLEPIAWPIRLAIGASQGDQRCHFPKPVLFAAGADREFLPEWMPFQIFVLGPVAVAGVPSEMTTVAGLRLRRLLAERLRGQGVEHVVIGGLANDYSNYVTTPEEYSSQQYEGASTLYGPNTLPAYLQIFTALADSLDGGRAPASSPLPARRGPLVDLMQPFPWDGKAPWEKVGQVLVQPESSYSPGETVEFAVRSGHADRVLAAKKSLYSIEKKLGSAWVQVASDDEPNASVKWKRENPICFNCSRLSVSWRLPAGQGAGEYRIVHEGQWLGGPAGGPEAYRSESRPFLVR